MSPKEEDFFGKSTVAMIGLGLMGGSLAMAIRKKCKKLIGYDKDKIVTETAMTMGLIDHGFDLIDNSLSEADMIILAVPVGSIIQLLSDLPRLQPNPAVVLDLGSTKGQIVENMAALPSYFEALGGHPMCGKESAGLSYADPMLFKNSPFVFTPTPHTGIVSRKIASQLIELIDAIPIWMDADQHDRWVASTSHLPYLLANILASTTPLETAPLISTGFLSTTRLASSSIQMMIDIIKTNQDNILEETINFRSHLNLIIDLLQQQNYNAVIKELTLGVNNIKSLRSGIAIGNHS